MVNGVPWDLPRHSIHHDTPSAFPNNVPLQWQIPAVAGQSQEAREEEAREEEDREEEDREEEDREEKDREEEATIANPPPPDSQLAEVEDLVAAAQNARSVY